MGRPSWTKSLITITSIAVTAYYLHIPVPSELVNPWRARALTYVFGLCENVAYFREHLTGHPAPVSLQDWITSPPSYNKLPQIKFTDKQIEGVTVRIYRPEAVEKDVNTPAIVFLHGGGWLVADIYLYEGVTSRLSRSSNMTVVAVNYRKSARDPFPAPFDDCFKVTEYVLRRGSELGIDSSRVAIAGDSAGGNLAAAVSMRLRDEAKHLPNTKPLKLQVLVNPVLQALTFNTGSYLKYATLILTQDRMIQYAGCYLGLRMNTTTFQAMRRDGHVSTAIHKSKQAAYLKKVTNSTAKEGDYDSNLAKQADSLVLNPYVSPVLADNLKGLPPAYILAMEFDPLRDEAIVYAERLKAAGVKVDLWNVKGQVHAAIPLITNNVLCGDFEEIVDTIAKYIVKHNV